MLLLQERVETPEQLTAGYIYLELLIYGQQQCCSNSYKYIRTEKLITYAPFSLLQM